jgi:hypothetical protein
MVWMLEIGCCGDKMWRLAFSGFCVAAKIFRPFEVLLDEVSEFLRQGEAFLELRVHRRDSLA